MLGAALLVGCGGGGSEKGAEESVESRFPADVAQLYDYDRSIPLDLRDEGVLNPTFPAKTHDVGYRSPLGGRVPAFLVVPPGKGPFPGVVFLHGASGSRLDFLVTATKLAQRGVVTLTITSPFERGCRPRLPQTIEGLRTTQRLVRQTVVDLRRGIDLLQSRSDVDPKRIGFVGFSRGAQFGAILAAVEPRLKAVDLISGSGEISFNRAIPEDLRDEAAPIVAAFEPKRFVAHVRSPLLFQVGLRDELVPRRVLVAFFRAAPPHREVRWYDAEHDLDERAIRDFFDWFAKRLDLKAPAPKG